MKSDTLVAPQLSSGTSLATDRPLTATAPSPAPSRTAFILAFAAIYLIWGSTYLGIRVAIESIPPFLMVGTRFLIAGGLLFAFLKLRGAPWPTRAQWRTNTISGTFLLFGGNGLVVWAERSIPSGLTALLIAVGPLFMVLTEWAWPGGTRPSALTAFALLLGFAGSAWLAAPWETSGPGGGLDHAGLIALIFACVFWSFGSIYSRHARQAGEPLFASSIQMLMGGAVSVVAAAFLGDFGRLNLSAVTPASWFAFAYLVTVGSLVGFSTFVWLMKHSTPARVSTYAYVNPVVAIFLGWLLLGEPVNSRIVAGSAIIIVAVAIITAQKNRSKKAR